MMDPNLSNLKARIRLLEIDLQALQDRQRSFVRRSSLIATIALIILLSLFGSCSHQATQVAQCSPNSGNGPIATCGAGPTQAAGAAQVGKDVGKGNQQYKAEAVNSLVEARLLQFNHLCLALESYKGLVPKSTETGLILHKALKDCYWIYGGGAGVK